jgi:AraC-like DNA-binding protein
MAVSMAVREWWFYIRAGSPYAKSTANADLLGLFQQEIEQMATVNGVLRIGQEVSHFSSVRDSMRHLFAVLNSTLRTIAEEWEDPLLPGVLITERRDAFEYLFAKKLADEMYLSIPYLRQLFKPDGQGVSYRRDYSVEPPRNEV